MTEVDYFKLVFSIIYGEASKSDQVAQVLFKDVIECLKNDCQLFDRKESTKSQVISCLTKATLTSEENTVDVIFKCQYGCAIILKKERKQSPIDMYIVAPQQWSSGAHDWKKNNLDFCQPKNNRAYYMPRVAENHIDLKTFVAKFKIGLSFGLDLLMKYATQDKVTLQQSAKTIHKACKIAVENVGVLTFLKDYQKSQNSESNKQSDEKKHYKGEVQNIDMSKSTTNTSWYVPQAVIIDLISSHFKKDCKEVYQKVIIAYLGNYLEKTTRKKVQLKIENQLQAQKEVTNFKKCLDLIIEKYKKSISLRGHPVNMLKQFMSLIKKIKQNIDKITNNGLTSQIRNKVEVPGQLKFTGPKKASIIKPEKLEQVEQVIKEAQISDYRMNVGKRLPFEELLEIGSNIQQKKLKEQTKWILLVQRTFFKIAQSFKSTQDIIDLGIHMREIECEIGSTSLCQIVQLYQKIILKESKHFGCGLQSQSRSHIQLVKTIAAVIAFESVKMNRQRKQSNLSKYRIPIDVTVFYEGFESNSYEARRAMKCLVTYHNHRKNRIPVFLLNGRVDSFQQFGKLVAKDTRSAHVWIDNMKKMLQIQKLNVMNQVKFKDMSERFQKALSQLNRTTRFYSNDKLKSYQITCYGIDIVTQLRNNEPWFFAFLENIPSDVLGMMKTLYLAQNLRDDHKQNKPNLFHQHFPSQQLSLKIYSQRPDDRQSSYYASNISTQYISVNNSFSTTKIVFNNCSEAIQLTSNTFEKYNQLFHKKEQNQLWGGKLSYILDRPSDKPSDLSRSLIRQHRLYAYQSQKPNDIQIEDFLAIGNVRSANYTQLMILCSNILQRKIISNSYVASCLLSQQVILHTAGHMLTFNPKIQKEFKQATTLISEFIKIWGFTDVNFCPTLGPLFGYLSRELIDNQILNNEEKQIVKGAVLKLCQKCIDQYNRGQQQLKQKPEQKIQWAQRFITMAAIICFRQTVLTLNDEKQILILCELVFQLRTCQILSGRQEKPKGLREFEKQLIFSVNKTIFSNIEVMSTLLEKRFDHIQRIIQKMDPSYPTQVEWQKVNLFAFKGKSKSSKDFYQIDLFHGKIFKNGKQISALEPQIKANPYFKKIFGQQREFQVFQSHIPNFLRTKNTINHYFKISESVGKIFLEFSQDGKEIRHIFQKKGEPEENEQIWVMVPQQRIKKSKCHIPKIFTDDHIAWYSESRNCMMFRRIKLEQIFNVGMVLHFKGQGSEDMMNLQIGFYITYNGSFDDQNLDELCNKNKKTSKYNEIKLRSSEEKLNNINCYKQLSRFEPVEYILELENKNCQIEYFLHRYQSKFLLFEQTRLESQSYFGYSIDAGFQEDQNSLFKKFPCLILKKHSKRPELLNSHQRICIISDGEIRMGGEIYKTGKATDHIDSYKYEVHDFYGDLRGSSRQALLHLSAVMLSINDNIRISSIEMTPLDYSIYLLNSCVNNIPLSKRQMAKIDSMVRNLQAPESLVLMLQALWTCSKALVNILPFKQQQQRSYFYILGEEKLMMCRTLYEEKLLKGSLRYGQRLQTSLMQILGLKYARQQFKQSNSSETSLQSEVSQSDSDFQKPEKDQGAKFWVGQKKYNGQNLQSDITQIQTQFDQFNKLADDIKKMWQKKKELNKNDKNSSKFPKKIHQLATNKNSNPMTKQMINDMEQSYNTFSQEQKRIDQIIKGLNKQNLNYLNMLVGKCSQMAANIVQQIVNRVIQKIKQKTSKLPDYISGERPMLSYVFFTKILCEKGMIKEFLPHLQPKMERKITNTIKIWVQLKTRIASFERIKQLLDAGNSGIVDYVALMREIQSPRQQVRQKNYWLCYEAENKMQLWLSQLKTYQNLKNPGDFCQLNMGQGKTQVIIPMMILESTYGTSKHLPRINLLSSLIEQARGNFFRFLGVTGFQLYGFEMPFTREVHLCDKTLKKSDPLSKRKVLQAKQSNVPQIQDLIVTFSSKLYILMTRQSRLSQILRYYETHQIDSKVSMQECPLIPSKFKVFDIFDEIDELMNPLKSYIFSIGTTVDLPEEKVRLQVLRVLIETFLKKHLKKLLQHKMVISEETPQLTDKFVTEGKYPPGLRLNLSKFSPEKLKAFRKSLAQNTIEQLKNDYFSFFKKLEKKKQQKLIDYIINPMDAKQKMPLFVRNTWRNQILILRGAIGFGIFQHCLSMRCGVDYGVPGPDHKKKIAVPYDAADIPSKTSEYQHPDLSSILSYCAYYTKGLTPGQFEEALKRLLSLSATSKEVEYKAWYISLSDQTRQKIKVKQAQQININSKALVHQLYVIYRRNRRAISFWLNKCIFPSNLKQYTKSIQASAWDFADVAYSVGFSGTKDNRWLYSNMLNWKPCDTASIKGTDGKMIHLITKFTQDIKLIPETQDSQWQRFVSTALKMKVGCIIDAGALCVGKSLENEIVPWIAAHCQFQHTLYHGISYCDEYGRWKVYDIESKHSIRRGTSIPDHETFVLFDEARTRGADLKMSADVVAAISLGPKMTKDKFMQAAGRLRKLGRDQKLIIMATQEIFATLFSINDYQKVESEIKSRSSSVQKREQLTHEILAWCCKNAIQQNERLLVQFSNLGWDYIRSKEDKRIFIKDISSELPSMYEHGLQRTTVAKLNEKKINSLPSKYVTTTAGKQITRKLNLYGEKVVKQASTLDDVCERQVQPQPQVQKSQQDPYSQVTPIAEISNAPTTTKIPQINVVFDKKFVLSENFVNTTQQNSVSLLKDSKNSKQLSELYFIIQNESSIKAITLREASQYIKSHIIDEVPVENEKISFLSSLKIQDEKIKAHQLQSALVSAKFVSGIENYSQDELECLLKIFIQSGNKVENQPEKYEKLTSSILRKKRVYYKKYFGSSLEKLVITLKNEDLNGQPQQDEVQENNQNEAEIQQNNDGEFEPMDVEATQDKMDEE